MSILNTGFENLSEANFIQQGRDIVAELSSTPGSTYFPTAGPVVIDLTDLLNAYEATLTLGNAPGAAADRAAAREAAADKIVELAALLESVSLDRTKLAHTGYPLRKIRENTSTPTGTPQSVSAKPTGIPGEVKFTAQAVEDARTYEARATQNLASGPFVNCPPSTSIRGLHFTGLERGKDWFFQLRAIGPQGVGPWSDPAMMMVRSGDG